MFIIDFISFPVSEFKTLFTLDFKSLINSVEPNVYVFFIVI